MNNSTSFAAGATVAIACLVLWTTLPISENAAIQSEGAHAPEYSRLDCYRDALILEKATRYAERAAEQLRLARNTTLSAHLNAMEGRGGDLWEMMQLSSCSERAQKAYRQYISWLGQIVDGPKMSNWRDLTPMQQKNGLEQWEDEKRKAWVNLRVEMNVLRQDASSR